MSRLGQPPALGHRVRLLQSRHDHGPDTAKISILLANPKWFEYTNPLNWNQEELKSLVSSPEVHEQHNMLVSHKPAPKIDKKLTAKSADLGTLSCFSLEVLQELMNNMDFLTLERFARTCRYARIIVNHHPTFDFVMKHAPHIRDLLSNTRLLYWHSILNIKAELQFPDCRSCGSTASYLYLPTCERICPTCCNHNINYWCIDLHDAKQAFALESSDIRCIPILRHKPQGSQHVRFPGVLNITEWLCPVKCALESGLQRWGTLTELRTAAERISPDRYGDATALERADARRFRLLRATQPNVQGDASVIMNASRLAAGHTMAQTTATMIPHVERSYDEPTKRYLCKGCLWAYVKKLQPAKDQLEYMGIDPNLDTFEIVAILERRTHVARTWPEMVVHITKCISSGIFMWIARSTEEDKRRLIPRQ